MEVQGTTSSVDLLERGRMGDWCLAFDRWRSEKMCEMNGRGAEEVKGDTVWKNQKPKQ